MNLLPNINWQVACSYIPPDNAVSAMNAAGTALQLPVVVQSFPAGVEQPTILCSDTKELHNGSIITFGPSHGGLSGYGLRVFDLVQNVSFKVQIPFQLTTPGSSSLTCYAVGVSNTGQPYGPDGGWFKTPSLTMWVDDFSANRCPGAKRVLGLRKNTSGNEAFAWKPRTKGILAGLRGRRVALGMLIRQKAGAGGARIYIYDGTTITYSAPATGASFTDANENNYQFLSVSALLPKTTDYVEIGLEFGGSIGDIAYLGTPTLKYGSSITRDDLGQNPGELLRADSHINPPRLNPLAGQWPGNELVSGSGLYGYPVDLEALSYGQYHSSLAKVNMKVEYISPTPNSICFVAALEYLTPPVTYLTFGLQVVTQVPGLPVHSSMSMVPLIDGYPGIGSPPGMFTIFSNMRNGAMTSLVFDMDDAQA